MKILFTLLCIQTTRDSIYVYSTKKLVEEILNQTNHDILVSTNSTYLLDHFKNNNRITIRDNITKNNNILMYDHEFNYNLKYHSFDNINHKYDAIIYLDCDIKLDGWSNDSEKYISHLLVDKKHNFCATRLNCSLLSQVDEYIKTGHALFSHKIKSYEILENYKINDDIMFSLLPSEHFLIFQNDPIKIKKFYNRWSELNTHLESINGDGGSWGDGFEIGISARHAGFHSPVDLDQGSWDGILGFKFNGNKN